MLKFYRNTSLLSLALLLLTALIIYAGAVQSNLSVSLFPARDPAFLWRSSTEPTVPDGKTATTLLSDVGNIDFQYFLDPEKDYPYTHYSMYFIDSVQPYKLVDLTRFSGVSFKVICDPKNVLLFVLFSFDEKVTNVNKPVTRRVSSTAFTCDNKWDTVTVSFDHLDTPHWWLGRNGYDFSDRGYQLNKTMGFAWVNSLQSPLNTMSHVKVTDVTLVGRDFRFLYIAIALTLALWILFVIWIFRRYVTMLTIQLKDKVKQDQPLMAYKKLSIEPQKDKEKSSVLRFMATEYAKADLSLESAATQLGINRTKINDILKDELGLTFTAYLNKLRLTEAARLLSENEDVNVSEIAYLVGYNNPSYFNKLFKIEYDCTPKTFKALYKHKDAD
ncbi:MAG: AraC family transcriptional regulator [Gammaproteobacteria bacterium]|nr:MAG: AraC family transcriptional regulator [Gammaproteobacteria bacterium]